MIVKSMSRKAPTFSQLAAYIGQNSVGDSTGCFSRNLYYQGGNQKIISDLFYENYKYLPQRKNGNALYHEVIVLPQQAGLDRDQKTHILQSLANKYCELRAPHQLAWGRVHFDTKFPHIHLMISANDVKSNRRVRLEKQHFGKIQKELEDYKERQFPQLVDERVYTKADKSRLKIKSDEGEMIRRTGAVTVKQRIKSQIETALSQSQDISDFKLKLQGCDLCLYQRGKYWGVENIKTGKRYRLKTLGLSSDFEAFKMRPSKPKDERAQALLQRRADMDEHAQEQLSDFDRENSDGFER